jgi:hypothetical protein
LRRYDRCGVTDHLLFTSVAAQIRFAIQYRRLLQLHYKRTVRVAEPHDYGIQKGIERLLVFQIRASGRTGRDAHGWRLLDVAKMSMLDVLDEAFSGSRHVAGQRHTDWDVLYARVT